MWTGTGLYRGPTNTVTFPAHGGFEMTALFSPAELEELCRKDDEEEEWEDMEPLEDASEDSPEDVTTIQDSE